MRERSYSFKGDPIPLARPRYGHKKVWDTQKNLKLVFGIELSNQHQETGMFTGPLLLDVTFHLEIPVSWSTKRRHSYIGKHHVSKPDLSNLIKFIEDVATGILYSDDALIARIEARKVYSLIPGTEFTLRELGNG